jgi:hypothetical protein
LKSFAYPMGGLCDKKSRFSALFAMPKKWYNNIYMITQERPVHQLKFHDSLAVLISEGIKRTTWRLHNTRDFQPNDTMHLLHKSTLRMFGTGVITAVDQRTFATLRQDDYIGHEPFATRQQMLDTYADYYSSPVGLDTEITVVKFDLRLICTKPGDDETDVIVIGNAA